MLPEDKRQQLDAIVTSMVANKEDDNTIRFVVDDFKQKYSVQDAKPQKGILQKTGDVLNKIFPGKQVGEAIGTLAGLGISKAKGTSEFYDTSAPSPLQVGGDILKGAATVGAAGVTPAASLLGKSAQFGALGATTGAGQALVEKKPAGEVATESLKSGITGAAIGAAIGLAGKGIRAMSNLLGKGGEKIQTSVIKPSQADIKDGFKIETVNKYNLGGSLKNTFEKTDLKLDELSRELNTKLAANKTPVNLTDVYDKTAKRLFGNKLENFGSNAQMEGAIEKLRQEIVGVAGENGLVSIPEAQLVKRASGHFGAWSWGIPTPEATASQKVYNTFYNELKTAIEKSSPEGIKEINKQISELIPVMNALIRRIPVAERNSAISLTDIISLTGATLDPRALSISLINRLTKSGTIGAVLSKTPKAGETVSKAVEPIGRVITNQLQKSPSK